jgi:hypothetical protein
VTALARGNRGPAKGAPPPQWAGRLAGLDIEVAAVDAVSAAVDLAVACLFEHEVGKLAGGMQRLDQALAHAPTQLRAEGVFKARARETLLVRRPPTPILAGAVLVLGLGAPAEFEPEVMAQATRRAFDAALLLGAQSVAFAPSLLDAGLHPKDDEGLSRAMITGLAEGARAAQRLVVLGLSAPSSLICWRFAASAAHLPAAADGFRRAVARHEAHDAGCFSGH